MPTRADPPAAALFPLTPEQARAAASVVFRPIDRGDKLTRHTVKMVEGDQWLNGEAWPIPWPTQTSTGVTAQKEEARRGFVSRNILAEINGRHTAGVLGREPRYDLVPRKPLPRTKDGAAGKMPPELAAKRDTALAALTAWWDKNKPHREMREALRYALYAERGIVRPYIHLGKLAQLVGISTEPGTVAIPAITSLDDALDLIAVEAVHPNRGTVTSSPRDGSPVSIVYYPEIDAQGKATWERAEWAFLLENGDTLLVDMPADMLSARAKGANAANGPRPATAATLTLGRRVPVVEFKRERLITPQVLQLQAAYNFALSVAPKTLAEAGWPERTFLNAEPPGTWEYDANGIRKPGTFIPAKYRVGARTTNFVLGVPLQTEDQNGIKQTLTNPSLVYRPPVDPVFAFHGADGIYRALMEHVGQAHIFLTQEGEASGRSHEMARVDFEGTLNDSIAVVNPAGRAFLEAVLALAEDLLGTPGTYTDVLRAEFQCRPETGKQTAAEAQADDLAVQNGRLSIDSAMERSGVDDVAAERARRDNDPVWQMGRLKLKAEIMGLLTAANVDALTAAQIVENPSDLVKLIKAMEPIVPLGPQPTGDPNAPPPASSAPPNPPKAPTNGSAPPTAPAPAAL